MIVSMIMQMRCCMALKNFKKHRVPVKQVNEFITHNTLRVIDDNGQIGILSRSEAINLSIQRNTDIVVINEKSEPPVAKLLNAGKYFYEQKRREKEAAKKQRENQIVIKEMQFRLGIDQHDFDTKCKSIIKFIEKNNKVKCVIRYKGRENSNKQAGFGIMDRIMELVQTATWDTKPAINGNRMIGILMRKE